MSRLSLVLVALVFAACGGSDAPPPAAPAPAPVAPAPASGAGDSSQLEACVAIFARQKACTDEFIPALVDARIKHDVPAGVAEEAANGGRDALIQTALTEWATDSEEATVRANCTQMIAEVPPEQVDPMLAFGTECAAKPACGEFVACILPQIEQHLAAGK